LRQLELTPGLWVLDAGCGPGRLAVPIAEAVGPAGRVFAMDIQQRMLDRARVKADRASVRNIEFLHAPLGAGRLPVGTFDRAVLVTVLGEIPDRLAALGEIFRALKPGGFLLVSEVLGDPHYQSLKEVDRLARAVGFIVSAPSGGRLAYSVRLRKPMEVGRG
jgi:ubiquinone/menaquinone biosynthesis C-methylase UbiE